MGLVKVVVNVIRQGIEARVFENEGLRRTDITDHCVIKHIGIPAALELEDKSVCEKKKTSKRVW
jgi:hypothetical protein